MRGSRKNQSMYEYTQIHDTNFRLCDNSVKIFMIVLGISSKLFSSDIFIGVVVCLTIQHLFTTLTSLMSGIVECVVR